jgi:hypothetical protein
MLKRTIATCSYEALNNWLKDAGINVYCIFNVETLSDGTFCIWHTEQLG